MSKKFNYTEEIRLEDKRAMRNKTIFGITLAVLLTGAAAWVIVDIIQHPNNQTEQNDQRRDTTGSTGSYQE